MKTQQQILQQIELYRPFIVQSNGAAFSRSIKLFSYIHTYLFTKYGDTNNENTTIAAAMLCDVFLQCTDIANTPDEDLITNYEDGIIKMLTLFDIYFDFLFTKYQNSNGNILPTTAMLMKYNSTLACPFYAELNGGLPYILLTPDFLYVGFNGSSSFNVNNNDQFMNMPDGINTPGLTIDIVTPPTKGTLNLTNLPEITYEPDNDTFGADSFTYRYLLDGQPIAQNNPFTTVTVTVASPPLLVAGNPMNISFSRNSIDLPINVADVDTFENCDRNTPGFAIEITEQPEHGTITVDVNNNLLFTSDGANFTQNSFKYVYKINGNIIPIDTGGDFLIKTMYLDFFSPQIQINTESVQGRLTFSALDFSANFLTPSTFITSIATTGTQILLPLATPNNILDNDTMIVPTGNIRSHIETDVNEFRYFITYTELGVPKEGYFSGVLPNFLTTDNRNETVLCTFVCTTNE